MSRYYRMSAALLVVATSLMAVGATAGAASAAPMTSAGPAVKLVIDSTSFGTAKGTTITVHGTGVSPRAGTQAGGAITAGTCYIGGSFPYVIDTTGTERRINFTASLNCTGISGQVELTVGLQQQIPGGGYVNDKFAGPYQNATPLIIQGVNSDPKHCAAIGAGAWRGVAHPRLISGVCIYDFGWWITYDVRLGC